MKVGTMIDENEMAKSLGLPPVAQAWGATYADPKRAEEFLKYAQNNRLSSLAEMYILELILDSANRAIFELQRQPLNDNDLGWLKRRMERHPCIYDYWIQVGMKNEFPIVAYLMCLE